jgi:hypothetical protein
LFAPPRHIVRARSLAPVMWLPGDSPPIASLAELAVDTALLCPETAATGAARPWWGGAPPASPDTVLPAVTISLLPPWTVVFGGAHFVTAAQGRFVSELFPPGLGSDYAAVDAVAPFDLPVEDVAAEVLLAGRPGPMAQGDWIGACLADVVLAEYAWPGRYRLLVPDCVRAPLAALLLEALGVGPDRLIVARPDRQYRFTRLFAVQGGAPGGIPHPSASDLLRARLGGAPGPTRSRIAIAGPPGDRANAAEIERLLGARGFAVLDPDAAAAQVLQALPSARMVYLAPGVPEALLMAAADGVAAIVADPAAESGGLRRALVGARNGRLAELTGAASAEALSEGVVLDPHVLAGLLEPGLG